MASFVALATFIASITPITPPAPTPAPRSETVFMTESGSTTRTNRLARERSPYLLQHARNPVDWYPWGEEAFARARAEDRPIFLSVGYSTCHWCHVMERESFERGDVAAVLNAGFIAIKVDREERPDIDDIYMKATQLITGRGGWPNSVWLTPDGRPWYAGTYFPPDDHGGRPGFKTVLANLSDLWRTRREAVEAQAEQLAAAVREAGVPPGPEAGSGAIPGRDVVAAHLRELRRSFDEAAGGFGRAPKFPPHGALQVMLNELESPRGTVEGDTLLDMTVRTLDAMARGGIHDHVGGGFHRYSTDGRWFLPHFEKMLYDNAQLGRAYTDAWALTGRESFRETARGIYEWTLREMRDPAGGFHSAIDADSEGEEGRFYLWSRRELLEALGGEEGALFSRVYGASDDGNHVEEAGGGRTGTNILHLPRSIADAAAAEGLDAETLARRLERDRGLLLARRATRVRPHQDDKVLAAWNGLMIGSLAHAGQVMNEPRYVEAARVAAEFVMSRMYAGGRLERSWRAGEAHIPGYLDDYAFVADGLLELAAATGDPAWNDAARRLMETVIGHFRDPLAGGFFFSSDEHEMLLHREKDSFDEAVPSGNGMAALVLVKLWETTGDTRWRDEAARLLTALRGSMERAPRGTESLVLATARYHDAGLLSPAASRGAAGPVLLASLAPGGAGGSRPKAADSALAAADTAIASDRRGVLEARLFAPERRAAAGAELRVRVELGIDPGWHVNSARPLEDYLIPTMVSLDDSSGLELADVHYPRGVNRRLAFSDDAMSVYEGTVTVNATLTIPKQARPGALRVMVRVEAQPCNDESCIAPETLELPLDIEVDER